MTRSDPGVVMVRPFTLDDLEAAADFCDRARAADPSIEPFSQRLALIATGPRAMLPLWQVAEGEDGLIYGLVFAAVREQRDAGAAKVAAAPVAEIAKALLSSLAPGTSQTADASLPPAPAKPPPILSRPPRQPYAGAPDLGAFAGSRIGKPPPILPLAPALPERAPTRPMTLQPARRRESIAKEPVSTSIPVLEVHAYTSIPAAPAKPLRTTLEIYAAVDPKLRRQSLGRALLAPALQWIEEATEPCSLRARVKDSPESVAGLAFLRSLGFKQSQPQLSLSWSAGSSPIEAHELPALSLKQLQPQDAAGLAQLARLSEAAWIGAPDSFQTRADELAQLMSELGRLVILASTEGRAVGYLSGVWLGKTLGIEEVAVLPELRRAGVGRALVTFALKLGARSALLSVSEENTAARTLYRTLGFQQVSRKLILNLDSAERNAGGATDSPPDGRAA